MRVKCSLVVLFIVLCLGPVQAIDLIITGSGNVVPDIPTTTIVGRQSPGTGPQEALTPAQAKGVLGLDQVSNTSDATKNAASATLTNKVIVSRECTNPGTASPILINADTCDVVTIPELSQAITYTFSPPTATIRHPHQTLMIIVTTTVQRSLIFSMAANGFSADNGLALPTFTRPAGRVKYLFAWNPTTSTWALDATTQTTTYGVLGEYLRSNGPGSEPSFQPGGAGSSTTSRNLPVTGIKLNDGVSTPATLDRSANNDYLLFDTATRMCVIWGFVLPDDYAGTPIFVMDYTMLSAGGSGGIAIDVDVMHVKTGANINTNSYDSVNTCTDTTLPADNLRDRVTCALTNVDTWVAGDPVKLRLCRNITHTSDTAAGHLAVFDAALRYTK